MARGKGWLILFALGLLLGRPSGAETLEQVLRAKQGRRVFDFAQVLSPAEVKRLHVRMKALESARLAQGAIVVLQRTEGGTPERFANRILNRWGVGERGKNNGFVLLVALEQRSWRLETGTGLERSLTDAAAERLMKAELVPAFRKKRYAAGLERAVDAIHRHLKPGKPGKKANRPAPLPAVAATTTVHTSGPQTTGGAPVSGLPVLLTILVCLIVLYLPLCLVAAISGWRAGALTPPGGNQDHLLGRNPAVDNSWPVSSFLDSGSSGGGGDSGGCSGSFDGGSGDGGGASGSW